MEIRYLMLIAATLSGGVTADINADTARCDGVFTALINMRDNLTNIFNGCQNETDRLKIEILQWTNIDVDNNITFKASVCQIVAANSLDGLAAGARIPRRLFPEFYLILKNFALSYRDNITSAMSDGNYSSLPVDLRKGYGAFIELMAIIEHVGLLSYEVAEPPARTMGCYRLRELGHMVYVDFYSRLQTRRQATELVRRRTGIDFLNWNHVQKFLCKLGEVSDLRELSAVLNIPREMMLRTYPRYVRLMELELNHTMTRLETGALKEGETQQMATDAINLMEAIQQLGIWNLR